MNIKDVNEDRYIVKIDSEKNTQTDSGLIIETADDSKSYKTGVIINHGYGRMLENGTIIPCKYPENTRIMFEMRNQIDITLDSKQHVIIRESNIISSID
jgi:chaperonin GroES